MLINFDNFFNFLEENHIIATVIATLISTYITSLSQSLSNDILLPIFNRDGDEDGVEDINKYENYVLKIFKIKFKVGHFFTEVFKFIVMTFLIYYFTNGYKILKKDN